jgi:hypothetical protein
LVYAVTAILILIFLITASLLLIPFHVYLQLHKTGPLTEGDISVSLLGLTLIRRRVAPEERRKERPPVEKKKPKRRPTSETISLLWESFPHLPRIIRTFMKSLSVERFSCDVVIGLGDPADTGFVTGILWSLASMLNVLPRIRLSIVPDFAARLLDGSVMAELRVRLLWIAVAITMALMNRPVRRLFLAMRR